MTTDGECVFDDSMSRTPRPCPLCGDPINGMMPAHIRRRCPEADQRRTAFVESLPDSPQDASVEPSVTGSAATTDEPETPTADETNPGPMHAPFPAWVEGLHSVPPEAIAWALGGPVIDTDEMLRVCVTCGGAALRQSEQGALTTYRCSDCHAAGHVYDDGRRRRVDGGVFRVLENALTRAERGESPRRAEWAVQHRGRMRADTETES